MKNLQNFGVQELNTKEIKEIEGGGWIADFVSTVIEQVKCACQPSTLEIDDFSLYLR
jgi:hypothetical protein